MSYNCLVPPAGSQAGYRFYNNVPYYGANDYRPKKIIQT